MRKQNVEDLQKMKGSFIKRQKNDTSSDNKWQRVTTSGTTIDSKWQRVTTNDVPRVTTSGTASDIERQRVTTRGHFGQFSFFRIREEPTVKQSKENPIKL